MTYQQKQALKIGAGSIGIIMWALVSASAYQVAFRRVSWGEVWDLTLLAGTMLALMVSVVMLASGIALGIDSIKQERARKRRAARDAEWRRQREGEIE